MTRPSLLVLTKNDAWTDDVDTGNLLEEGHALPISSVTGSGIPELVSAIVEILDRAQIEAKEAEIGDA